MLKRIISIFLSVAAVVCMSLFTFSANAASGNGLSISETKAGAGDTFTVTLKAPAATSKISDVSLKFSFDNSVFTVKEITAPSVPGASVMTSDVTDANKNGFVGATVNSMSGDASISFSGCSLSVTFQVKASVTPNKYRFDVTHFVIGSVDTKGLPVVISDISALSAAERYVILEVVKTEHTVHTFGPWKHISNNTHKHTCTVCGFEKYSPCTPGKDGKCTVCGGVYNKSLPKFLPGDLNDDGIISPIDSGLLLNVLLGNIIPNERMYLAADINGDGNIDAIDANMMVKLNLGFIISE